MSEAHENELLQNIASLEGQALAQKVILAMLVHCARTSQSFEVVYREIDSIKQLFIEGALTMFPSQRIFSQWALMTDSPLPPEWPMLSLSFWLPVDITNPPSMRLRQAPIYLLR